MSASPYPLRRQEAEDSTSTSPIPLPTPHRNLFPDGVRQPQPTDLWITDDLLFDFQRCHRRAYLNVYGDLQHRDPPSDYLKKLRQDSLAHQVAVLGSDGTKQPQYPRGDWWAGAIATLDLMRQGVERIARGVLLMEHEPGIWLISVPDLLIKQPGPSAFGDWHYVPSDIRLGKRPKLDYQLTSAYHAYVLAQVQEAWSAESWLLLRQRGAYAVYVAELLPQMREILDNCVAMLQLQQEPEVFIAHNRCDLCHWFTHCYERAEQEAHLSLLPGVTPSRFQYLRNLQLTTLEALATTLPRKLEPLPGFGTQVAYRLIQQARAAMQNRALPRPLFPGEEPQLLLTPEELPTAPIELYFDIEAAPEQNLVYLHGVLVADRTDNSEAFYPLMADHPNEEEMVWDQFLALMDMYPDAPVYHFCPFEVQTVRRLGSQYNTPSDQIESILDRFVDLHERVTRVAVLPVESYALKAIARWVGFDWRDSDANGAQSIFWYAEWRRTGDRAFRDAILRYNEDDCLATFHVKNWLTEFIQANPYATFDEL